MGGSGHQKIQYSHFKPKNLRPSLLPILLSLDKILGVKEGGELKACLSFFSFPLSLAFRHQSLACYSRFSLSTLRKTKCLRRRQSLSHKKVAGLKIKFTFRYFHIDHNAPRSPPKILHNCCFQFLLGITVVPREIKDNGYAKFSGVNKVHYGL